MLNALHPSEVVLQLLIEETAFLAGMGVVDLSKLCCLVIDLHKLVQLFLGFLELLSGMGIGFTLLVVDHVTLTLGHVIVGSRTDASCCAMCARNNTSSQRRRERLDPAFDAETLALTLQDKLPHILSIEALYIIPSFPNQSSIAHGRFLNC
jgi:hypothetical protein